MVLRSSVRIATFPLRYGRPEKTHRPSALATLVLFFVTASLTFAQEPLPQLSKGNATSAQTPGAQQQIPAPPAKRLISLSDAVAIFLQQNLQLVAARYDIDTADAEKLTARLRPNTDLRIGFANLQLALNWSLCIHQYYTYQTPL